MRTSFDALRSIKRYLALAFGEAWEVRLADEPGTFKPPFIEVEGLETLYSGPVVYTDLVRPVTVTVYPEPQPTIPEARQVAEQAHELLYHAFRVGVDLGRPNRIPLYDYEGKALDQPSDDRQPHDYLRVLDFSARLLPDTVDAHRVAVVADLRVTWRRQGRVSLGTLVRTVEVTQQVKSVTATIPGS